MGDSADDILQTLQLDEGTVSYDEIKKSLNDYFAERWNVIVERARFNKRSQKPGESVETFIQDLYRLANNCNYGALRDYLIRDQIVVGNYGQLADGPTRRRIKSSRDVGELVVNPPPWPSSWFLTPRQKADQNLSTAGATATTSGEDDQMLLTGSVLLDER